MSQSDSKTRINKITKKLQKPQNEIRIIVDWSTDQRKPEPGEIFIIWDQNGEIRTEVGGQKNEQNKA